MWWSQGTPGLDARVRKYVPHGTLVTFSLSSWIYSTLDQTRNDSAAAAAVPPSSSLALLLLLLLARLLANPHYPRFIHDVLGASPPLQHTRSATLRFFASPASSFFFFFLRSPPPARQQDNQDNALPLLCPMPGKVFLSSLALSSSESNV